MFQWIQTAEVGRKWTDATDECDCWDIDGLGHDGGEEMAGAGGEIWGQ
jgi:hypothetical protein